jgi:serine/threonine protein kinase
LLLFLGVSKNKREGKDKEENENEKLILEGTETSYECVERSGKGSFGVVFRAKDISSMKDVAIKRVLQDPRYKV